MGWLTCVARQDSGMGMGWKDQHFPEMTQPLASLGSRSSPPPPTPHLPCSHTTAGCPARRARRAKPPTMPLANPYSQTGVGVAQPSRSPELGGRAAQRPAWHGDEGALDGSKRGAIAPTPTSNSSGVWPRLLFETRGIPGPKIGSAAGIS